jgi:hypothetical protein
MKNVILAAATITAFAATGAAAEGLGIGVSGEVEYSVENENFAMEVGPDFEMAGIAIAPRAYASYNSNTDFSFDGVGVEAAYGVSANISVYGAVQTDGDWEYSDAQVGVRFNF